VQRQTYENIQLIIMDDASSDDSVSVINRWLKDNQVSCTFVSHEINLGICRTLNEALSYAEGKYVAMVAADDLWLPEKTERQVAIMECSDQGVGAVFSDAMQIDETGNVIQRSVLSLNKKAFNLERGLDGDIYLDLLTANFIAAPTVLILKNCYKEIGLYDENLIYEDYDMWLRLSRRYKMKYDGLTTAKYRIHANSAMRKTVVNRPEFQASRFIIAGKCLSSPGINAWHRLTILKRMMVRLWEIFKSKHNDANHFMLIFVGYLKDPRNIALFVLIIFSYLFSRSIFIAREAAIRFVRLISRSVQSAIKSIFVCFKMMFPIK